MTACQEREKEAFSLGNSAVSKEGNSHREDSTLSSGPSVCGWRAQFFSAAGGSVQRRHHPEICSAQTTRRLDAAGQARHGRLWVFFPSHQPQQLLPHGGKVAAASPGVTVKVGRRKGPGPCQPDGLLLSEKQVSPTLGPRPLSSRWPELRQMGPLNRLEK